MRISKILKTYVVFVMTKHWLAKTVYLKCSNGPNEYCNNNQNMKVGQSVFKLMKKSIGNF